MLLPVATTQLMRSTQPTKENQQATGFSRFRVDKSVFFNRKKVFSTKIS
jgi:hypothetical protein